VFESSKKGSFISFRDGLLTGFSFALKPRSQIKFGLKFKVPSNAKNGESYNIDVVERNSKGQMVGGITIQVNVTG